MKFLIDEEAKTITFECKELPISELINYTNKLLPSFPSIKSWRMDFKENLTGTPIEPEAKNESVEEVPEKPETPEFDYKNNTLPDDEGKP